MIKANEQDDGKHAWDDSGQGDQGEYEQQYGKKIVATYLFNIHTWVHQLGPSSNLNLNTTQHYYVDMPNSLPMKEDRAEENLVVNLNSLNQEQVQEEQVYLHLT